MKRIKGNKGFSLIELIVVMLILVGVIVISSNSFIRVIENSKQQSKIGETHIEKVVGLSILRQDIEEAGIGLAWNINGIIYNEATDYEAIPYNDAPNNPPRAIVSGDNVGHNNSDYLVIKSTTIRFNNEAQKWTYMFFDGTQKILNRWSNNEDNMQNTTRVIAINPNTRMLLRTNNGSFYTIYSSVNTDYTLTDRGQTCIIFGIDDQGNQQLRMPFNRADYYISINNVPTRCAPNTGVLIKRMINNNTGQRDAGMPLIDCVADFQVIYGLDANGDGILDTYVNANSNLNNNLNNANRLRNSLKEVRVYILAHEGQRDRNMRYSSQIIQVGEFGLGKNFDLTTIGGRNEYRFYRWKVYTLIVKPENLRG